MPCVTQGMPSDRLTTMVWIWFECLPKDYVLELVLRRAMLSDMELSRGGV